jgi:thiol-disulfide isomerase/thioredoxin
MLSCIAPFGWVLALVCLSSPGAAQDAGRGAEAILAELDATTLPRSDNSRSDDEDYVKAYLRARRLAEERRAELILELYRADPRHARVPSLLIERWGTFPPSGREAEDLAREVEEAIAKNGDPRLKAEGAYLHARRKLYASRGKPEAALDAILALAEVAPGDRRVARLLMQAAGRTADPAKKVAFEDMVIRRFPDLADQVKSQRLQREAVGQPFELEFNEATSGKEIRMADLRGKVVVVDFWALWCGPCVAQMPAMKRLYAEFRERGVEFIGISLDQADDADAGRAKFRAFVRENGIDWPQFYSGQGWESEIRKRWGIESIPAMFVVAPDGTLHSTQARGRLEQILPALLEQARQPDAGGPSAPRD